MTPRRPLPEAARAGIGRPLLLTRAGMAAERLIRAFWPLWSILLAALAATMMGLHESLPLEAAWAVALAVLGGAIWGAAHGLRRMRIPSEAEALERLDRTLPGRPIAALSDEQAVGAGDSGSRAVWEAHVARMAERIRAARPVRPDLRLAARDPFALRYAALLAFAMALLFGSVWRVGTVGQIAPGGGQAVAGGPAWEGWIEPPAYTGRPSLYLADLPEGAVEVPEGSRVTLQLYGENGTLSVSESVSPGADGTSAEPRQSFEVARSGEISVEGAGGRDWRIAMTPDAPPAVEVTGPPERAAGGEFRQPFRASDDFGVTGGRVRITLDLDRIERDHGLAPDPDPREPLAVDLPLPVSGDRSEFAGTLVETFSEHPWANLPVVMTYEVEDAMGQTGSSGTVEATLAGQRFFDPLAQAIVEQRRDLLWSRDNAARVAGLLRAASWQPAGLFPSETLYLRLRVAIRRLEAGLDTVDLSAERQEEIADELWSIATEIEFGDLDDARERLERAQERLSEAMENGADPSEIAELMQELREAMDDYIRQLAEQSEGEEGQQQAQGESQRITGDQLQQMMDEIQRLMEEGRMAEAQALMEQLNRMLENMRVTQGQSGQGQGDQAMQDLQETLRDQQELSDDSFRGMQDGQQSRPGQGQPGQQGQQGQPGQPGQQPGQGEGQSLADRQQALRDELNRQRGNLPGAGTESGEAARDSLDRAERAMEGAEDALRDGDTPRALDRQAEAMDALREGMRELGEALAEERGQGQGEGQAMGDPGAQDRDPLGREAGRNGQMGSDRSVLGGEDVRRRAEELLDEIRRRSGDQTRSEMELDYLRRLLDQF